MQASVALPPPLPSLVLSSSGSYVRGLGFTLGFSWCLWVWVSFGSHRFRVFGVVVQTPADLSCDNTWWFSGERMARCC